MMSTKVAESSGGHELKMGIGNVIAQLQQLIGSRHVFSGNLFHPLRLSNASFIEVERVQNVDNNWLIGDCLHCNLIQGGR